mgnify:CR=1 FL=1
MSYEPKKLKEALENGCPVFYFYSTEEYLLQSHAQKALSVLEKEDPDMTRIDGPTPDVEEILLAAGTVSFFSTRRVVFLPLLRPTTYAEEDFKLLCDALSTAENAVFVITSLFEEKQKKAKRVTKFIELCGKLGFAAELTRPSQSELVKELQRRLKELGYYSNSIDGSFGGKTEDAVKAFQKRNGLTPDGSVGRDTHSHMHGLEGG